MAAGQWWQCRDGRRVYVFAVLSGAHLDKARTLYPVKAILDGYGQEGYTLQGYAIAEHEALGRTSNRDLVLYLPECTGWDWKPEVWRQAKPEDLKYPAVKARFRDNVSDCWINATLCGYLPASYMPWIRDNSICYCMCQVLDES
jgi:hypothetical protein